MILAMVGLLARFWLGVVILLFPLTSWANAGTPGAAPLLKAASAGGDLKAERIRVTYWEKWTGFEKDGMQGIVDEFNESQDRIYVEYLTTSQVNQKALIATAGGVPPDVAGLWDGDVVVFADKNALIPLDDFLLGTNLVEEHYIPLYWDMCTYHGKVWALPSTPATTALHWNKEMFRKAGLDPEKPPRTFAELDAFSKRLTIRDPETNRITQMGFLPPEPGWWHHGWGSFFGGELWDGDRKILFDTPPYIEAFKWIRSYAEEYGVAALQTFRSSFGNFSSPQNPFMSEDVAMVLQGVWMNNYISQYSPDLEWGAAPFPVVKLGDEPVTFGGCDVLMIPRGAKHPREAFEFIKYVNQQGPMERLCLSHRKNSPLRKVSESFYREHKNPYIRMFQKLAWSKNAVHTPLMSVWNEYRTEIWNAFDSVWLMTLTPEEAVSRVQKRMQKQWDWEHEKHSKSKASPLLKVAPFGVAAGIVILVILIATLRERASRRSIGMRSHTALRQSLLTGLGFMSPWIIGLSILVLYPVSASIIYSFCDYSVLSEPRWVGLHNYADIFSDEVFRKSLWNTLTFAAFALPLGLILSFGVALLLDTGVKGMGLYRTIIFLPSVTPLVASAIVWMWIFNSEFGVLNHFIHAASFGYLPKIPWLTDSTYAMPALVFMSFWGIGHTVVILLASLQDVPVSLYEAADIDGASWWHKIWHVTIPLISPVILFNVIMGIIGVLQFFVIPYIMTGGGPERSTLFYAMHLYDNAFQYLRMGYACAMAWILFLIILALTWLAVRLSRSHVFYAGG